MTEPSEWADLWRDLCEKDDRTSPEEYPDMALLTFEEFCSLLDAARRKGIEEAADMADVYGDPVLRDAILDLADKEPT